ncbi:MAG TPA: cytochrome b/b6 domain-containing protein, partial [Steroidobacteraceae bacterium]|nr:cytochrome b/b6 domain-containing protein [Steroidobacteraceae bacterium]
TAQRIGRDGLFFGGGHLHPTWTPRRAHVAHHQYKPPGWLCGQDRTVTLKETVEELHEWFGNVVLILAAVHAAAALFHRLVLKDGVLRRMLPERVRQ